MSLKKIKSHKMKLDIIYEDKDLLIINKPSGMVAPWLRKLQKT